MTGRLWNYYRDEPTNPLSFNSESFKYKTSITGNTYNIGAGEEGYDANKVGKNETKVVIPLKHLSNFWKSLNIPLINCEVELILNWSKNCVLADMTVRGAQGDIPAIVAPTGLEFEKTDTELYVPVVSLSKENYIKLLEELKSGFKRTIYVPVVSLSKENYIKLLEKLKSEFKRTIKWNKYRSQMTIQPENNNLNYLINPTFTNVNRSFVLSFTIDNEGDNRDSFSDYYVPNVKIKDLMF